MCIAMPGLVAEVNDTTAAVDFSGNIVNAYRGLVDVKAGDYVLVHAGCIIQKLSKGDAQEILNLMGAADED